MRFGTDDQADQPSIEQMNRTRRRRIQLGLMSPSVLAATYRRTCRENPKLVHLTSGVPQDRTSMIAAILTIEQAATDADQ